MEKLGTISFKTPSQLALWKHEITGQLSDGAWENATPYNHWEFWCRLEAQIGVGKVETYCSYECRKTGYNLTGLIECVGKRMIAAGRMAKALQHADFKWWSLDDMPETFEEFEKHVNNGVCNSNYEFRKLSNFSLHEGARFYATTYTEKDLRADLKEIKRVMKTVRR